MSFRLPAQAVLAASLLFLAGCGGGQSGTALTETASTGRAVVAVQWPTRSRLIPTTSNSIRVDVLRDGTVLSSQLLVRPDTGASVLTFEHLPVVPLTVQASAFPETDGTGVAQASGTVPVTIEAGKTVSFDLTLSSTIDHITVSPKDITVGPGATAPLTATAVDASGNIVLFAPNKLEWSSSDASIASVNAAGVVQGVKSGKVQINVLETESGKSATVSVSVGARTIL